MSSRSPLALLLFASLAACGESPMSTDDGGRADGGAPDAGPPDAGPPYPTVCENINPQLCMLPWPSSFYLRDDPTTATGRRVEIPVEAMPISRRGRVSIDPAQFERFDGFSPAGSIITAYDGDIDPSNLADERHIADSLEDTSPTVVIDADTGERVAHFAEIDTWPYIVPERRPLYIRPAARLAEGHRYLVAIRDLHHPGGAAIEPSAYFRALRDGQPLADATDIEARRPHFEDIFTQLEAAGIERASLLEAWDFETASGESAWGEMIAMRDAALRAMAADTAPRCTVTRVIADPSADPSGDYHEENIWRIVEGTVRVPLFLNGVDPLDFDQSSIHRDASGAPAQNGWTDVPFVAKIPMSVYERVAAGGDPAPVLDYGHGLFGDRLETNASWFRDHLDAVEMVSVAIDWWGMSSEDVPRVVLSLKEFSTFHVLAERLEQGMINHIALQRAFREECATLPELDIPLTAGGTAHAIDPTRTYYYGNSQGGIFGLTLAGITVDVTHLASGVGGMSYSIMIPRSSNWQLYATFMDDGYPDPLEMSMIMVMGQTVWDLADPSTYVPHITHDPLPCANDVCASGSTPIHQILMQIGRDDPQVATITAEIAARSAGIGVVSPSPFDPYGMTPLTAAMGESLGTDALVIYDIPGVPALPLGTRDPGDDQPGTDGHSAHEGVRRSPAAIEQIRRFHLEGEIIQTCDGVCDPT